MDDDVIGRIKAHIAGGSVAMHFPVASPGAIVATESALGLSMPPILKSCYLNIANGGFGPGQGIIGVRGGHQSDYGDMVATCEQLASDRRGDWRHDMLPFCGWGDAMLSCVKCDASLQVFTYENGRIWPQTYTIGDFFDMWVDGVDILAHDPGVGFVDLSVTNPFTKRKQTIKVRRRLDA